MNGRLVILGAGESGIGAAILGKNQGWQVFVSDLSPIKEKYAAELQEHDIDFEEGKHSTERILVADLVIKSPGIPDKAPLIKQIKEKGISIISEIEFAYRYCKGEIIAITGSNGKTTTTGKYALGTGTPYKGRESIQFDNQQGALMTISNDTMILSWEYMDLQVEFYTKGK